MTLHVQQFKENGVHGYGRVLLKPGDHAIAVRNVAGMITKGTRIQVREVLVEASARQGYTKRIIVEGYDGDFNPKRFRRVTE